MVSKLDRPDRRRPLLTHVLRAQLLVKPAAAAPMRPRFRPRVHHRSAGRDRTASPGAPVRPGCPGGAGPLRTAVRTLRNAATPSGYSDQARRGPFRARHRSPGGGLIAGRRQCLGPEKFGVLPPYWRRLGFRPADGNWVEAVACSAGLEHAGGSLWRSPSRSPGCTPAVSWPASSRTSDQSVTGHVVDGRPSRQLALPDGMPTT